MAGDFQHAQIMQANLPLDSIEDSLYAWEAQLVINLYSQGQSWYDLDSASQDSLAGIVQYNKPSGYMAGAISALLNRGEVTWPVPMLDSATYDSLIVSIPSSAQRPGHEDDSQSPKIADGNAKSIFSVYPNPTNGSFIIQSGSIASFTIVTMLGQQVEQYTLAKGNTELTLPAGLAAGMYMGIFKPERGLQTEVKLIYQP